MGAVFFYHLTERTLAETLPTLLTRALGAGWRVAVRGPDAATLEDLDRALWTYDADSFLPHAMAGGAQDAAQPVLLTTGTAGNDPQCVMTIDGAALAPDEVARLERACILFDGHDDGAVATARDQWRTLTGAGLEAAYWATEGGSWVKKAASAAKS
ncbi:MAG: DNA polymerase III subunit chi [Shimia sp.]